VSLLYFDLFIPFHCFPLPFTPHPPPLFNSFQYISCLLPVFRYCWCSIVLFSFPSSPSFHSVVPLLPTHPTCRCVYMIMLVFVYKFIFWIYLCIWEKTCGFCLSELGFSLNVMSSNSIHLPSNNVVSSSLWMNKTPLLSWHCARNAESINLR
jgi:hypothetical protein